MAERFIWSINKSQKIRIREIREYNIQYDSTTESFFIVVHGYGFGKGITVFGAKTKEECITFVEHYTIPSLLKGGESDDTI